MRKDGSHLEVTGGQPDDAGLVELRGDRGRERQQLRQFHKLLVLLNAARSRCVLAFLFHPYFLRTLCGRGDAAEAD